MATKYKLTTQNMQTYNRFQWELGKWETIDQRESLTAGLCSPSYFHAYDDPLLAVFLNPIHADIDNPRLFRVEVSGKHINDNGLKSGWRKMRLIEELPGQQVTLTQCIAFGILCALEVYNDPTFVAWAINWLSGKNRTYAAAAYADAAVYAIAAYAAAAYAADAVYAVYAAYAADAAYAAYAAAAYADAAYAAYAAAYAAAAAAKLDLITIAHRAMTY